jgi:hypothetical protein
MANGMSGLFSHTMSTLTSAISQSLAVIQSQHRPQQSVPVNTVTPVGRAQVKVSRVAAVDGASQPSIPPCRPGDGKVPDNSILAAYGPGDTCVPRLNGALPDHRGKRLSPKHNMPPVIPSDPPPDKIRVLPHKEARPDPDRHDLLPRKRRMDAPPADPGMNKPEWRWYKRLESQPSSEPLNAPHSGLEPVSFLDGLINVRPASAGGPRST